MLAIGTVSFLICFFGSGLLANIFKNPDAALAVKAISPALLFVPLFSAFRGYFQGRQNMNPTAISEVTEQLVRVIAGLTLAWVLLHGAYEEPEVQAAAGASFGASAGSIAGLGIIFIIYLLNRRVIHRKIDLNSDAVEETRLIIKKIVVIAVPIIIGAEVMPIMNLLDTAIIMRRLQETGWTLEEAQGMYGLISGFCSPLIAFPQIFTQAVSVSLVPAIAGYAALKNRERIQENVGLAYRTTMIMAFPCAFGMFALSEPILLLLFGAQPESAREAAPILQIMAVGVVFLAIVQTSTGILQAVGRQTLPVKHLLLGCVAKGVLTYILVGIAAVNVKGAAIGTVVAYIIAMILNNRSVYVHTGYRQNLSMAYLRPGLAAAIMAAVAYGAYLDAVLKSVDAPYAYDAIGHVGYIARCSTYPDKKLYYRDFPDIIDAILKAIINKGKSLEINTSSKGTKCDLFHDTTILRRYKELGGELITFGSDAHDPSRLCADFKEAEAAAISCGFRYAFIYENHIPTAVKLDR